MGTLVLLCLFFLLEVAAEMAADDGEDHAAGRYGNMPLMQSQSKPDRSLVKVASLTPALAGQKVWVRGRLHTSRSKGE